MAGTDRSRSGDRDLSSNPPKPPPGNQDGVRRPNGDTTAVAVLEKTMEAPRKHEEEEQETAPREIARLSAQQQQRKQQQQFTKRLSQREIPSQKACGKMNHADKFFRPCIFHRTVLCPPAPRKSTRSSKVRGLQLGLDELRRPQINIGTRNTRARFLFSTSGGFAPRAILGKIGHCGKCSAPLKTLETTSHAFCKGGIQPSSTARCPLANNTQNSSQSS